MTNKDMMKVAFNAIIGNAQRSKTGRINAVIPVEMINADPLYQRFLRRNRKKLRELERDWDYNLMDPLIVVAHPETNDFYVVDGLGRLTVAKKRGLEELDCVIIYGPENPDERRIFEAKYFLRQAVCTDPLRPVAMHNARVLAKDQTAIIIETVCNEYGIEIYRDEDNSELKYLGSYDRTYKMVKKSGEDCLRWVIDVIKYAGYDQEKGNCYTGRLMTVLGKFYDGYPDIEAKAVGEFMRGKSPSILQADAISAYPNRAHNPEIPLILYLQDWATENKNKEVVFDINGKKMKLVAA